MTLRAAAAPAEKEVAQTNPQAPLDGSLYEFWGMPFKVAGSTAQTRTDDVSSGGQQMLAWVYPARERHPQGGKYADYAVPLRTEWVRKQVDRYQARLANGGAAIELEMLQPAASSQSDGDAGGTKPSVVVAGGRGDRKKPIDGERMDRVRITRMDAGRPSGCGNPFKMGFKGDDEKWRWVVCYLFQQWFDAGDVEAKDVRMPDGEELPPEVYPDQGLQRAEGASVRARVERLQRSLAGSDRVRLECSRACATACSRGLNCHGQTIESYWCQLRDASRTASTTQAGSSAFHATQAGGSGTAPCEPCADEDAEIDEDEGVRAAIGATAVDSSVIDDVEMAEAVDVDEAGGVSSQDVGGGSGDAAFEGAGGGRQRVPRGGKRRSRRGGSDTMKAAKRERGEHAAAHGTIE